MGRKRLIIAVVVAAVVIVLVGGVTWWVLGGTPGRTDPATAARTSFTDLETASETPTLPSLAGLHPAPGRVVQAAGPFDDRFRFERLDFTGREVTGEVAVTSDISDLLDLETVAGFYDRDGSLIGTGRDVYHLDESTAEPESGPPDEVRGFRIAVPVELRGRAVSAAVGVLVLVNE